MEIGRQKKDAGAFLSSLFPVWHCSSDGDFVPHCPNPVCSCCSFQTSTSNCFPLWPDLKHLNISYRFLCAVLSHSIILPWTVACQAPLSKGFFWQENWSGLPFPRDLPNSGIKRLHQKFFLPGQIVCPLPTQAPSSSLPVLPPRQGGDVQGKT